MKNKDGRIRIFSPPKNEKLVFFLKNVFANYRQVKIAIKKMVFRKSGTVN